MIDVERYLEAQRLNAFPPVVGGQELIVGEIAGALNGCSRVWFPFPVSRSLLLAVAGTGVHGLNERHTRIDAVYFGTPTIVGDKPLFDMTWWEDSSHPGGPFYWRPQDWTKKSERESARHIAEQAIKQGAKLIVSGLGTGDISVEQRLEDMGGGDVIAYKQFNGFEDWVLARRIA
jgi:hypothetical protein